eukprot:gene3741-4660_t
MKYLVVLFLFVIVQVSYGAEKTVTGELTFYAAGDNCPPSGEIAHPTSKHPVAGGVGTYADPITFAGASKAFPVHSIVYLPAYKKYIQMMDDCEECINEWNSNKHYHVDVWIGPDSIHKGTTDCEVALTKESTQIIINPDKNKPVDTTPFFSDDGKCMVKTQKCVDKGNECGNRCELPDTESCQSAADLFLLTLTRFKQLNPKINCNKNIASGTSVCMSGSCGGP